MDTEKSCYEYQISINLEMYNESDDERVAELSESEGTQGRTWSCYKISIFVFLKPL
jgi:hypothetical protein